MTTSRAVFLFLGMLFLAMSWIAFVKDAPKFAQHLVLTAVFFAIASR